MFGLEPILRLLRQFAFECYARWRTFGLHPLHRDHGKLALKRAAIAGGVRLR